MKRQTLLSLAAATSLYAQSVELDPIVVGADFRDVNLSQAVTSVTVIDEATIAERITEPFAQLLSIAPNVNFSAGASKPKYIQIRGIGERSQFQTPVNPSVGIIQDGMDLSQFPLGVSLFDVNHIEVLRGPQGTRFGANALAGVVLVESNAPSKETEMHVEATAGNYNTYAVGASASGTLIEDKLLGRISVFKNDSDGYMENAYLGRDDTNNIDELYVKAGLTWFASENHTMDLRYLHADVDNGYDAFTLDNSRTSHSDMPGKDALELDGVSLKSTYRFGDAMRLITQASYLDGNDEYSYDEDWSYVGEFPDELWPYSWFDQYLRDRTQWDIDVRLMSDSARIFNGMTEWTVGAYYKNYDETLHRNHYKDGEWEYFTHDYETKNSALYGQLDTHLDAKWTLITGLRVEKWEADYSDSDNFVESFDETLWGGKVGVRYVADSAHTYYATLSRGFKPGGFNASNELPQEDRTYDSETLYNLDIGMHTTHFGGALVNHLNFFYGKRRDQQVNVYLEQERSFTDYLDNAAEGTYYGVESQLDYYATDALHLFSRIGLLHAEFDDYTPEMDGRAPAHAPEYQYDVGLDYTFAENFIFKTDVQGMGSYYFSNTHNEKSKPYALLNASLTYVQDNWSATLWGRNLTDKDYAVRGFYFGNNPATGYEPELYVQKGEPRTFGVTVTYDF